MAQLWADFQGPVTGSEPMTWGQRSIWKAYSEFRPYTSWLNICRVLAVPRRAAGDVESVTRAVGELISRHESLRTRIDVAALRQVPHPDGQLPIAVTLGSAESMDAESIKDAMGEVPYDYGEEWPLRVTLVTDSSGRVTHLALVFSHVAVDFHASEILLRELRLILLRGKPPGPAGLQSLEIARREAGPMSHRSDAARAYWTKEYGHLPKSMFAEVAPPLTPRFRRALLESSAVEGAMRILAARHRVSTATVLLAATAALIGEWTGHDRCALFTMVNNRYQAGYQDAISKLNQVGLFVLELTGRPGLDELIPRTWQSALRAYRHAYYDPLVMDETLREIGRPPGSGLEPFCYFNDLRLPNSSADEGPLPELKTVQDALENTRLTWPETLERFAWRFRMQVLDTPRGVGLSVTADSAYLPPQRVEDFLFELEKMVVRAAHQVSRPDQS
ncbi:condensation domain-containing protein [Rhizocola hellebori]|uniref:condensation domain-containing protein n=1 Tax=Rhizocola hellebori TaxID=1392758 RepID=UPI00194048ED|nr:condensation domain-containing protein [Rhizocola hellebori]